MTPAPPLPDFLLALRDRAVVAACDTLGRELVLAGIAPEHISQAIVWRYPAGSAIGWHIDNKVFGPAVLSISLLGPARLQLRRSVERPFSLILEPCSLLVLAGEARSAWKHRITAMKAERVSLTFRPRGEA